MQQRTREHSLVRFGVYEIDLRSGELRKAGVRIKLQDLPFKVLTALLEHPGEVLTREDLRTRIWPHETFGDFDHAVNIAIGKLRVALGDSAENPRIIETLPRRGYRLIAAVQADIADDGRAAGSAEKLPSVRPKSRLNFQRGWAIAGVAAAALLAVVFMYRGIGRRYIPGNKFHSLAVLPLRNLSGDPNQDYFADGMTDELITSLAKIGSLRVISHTSTMRYRNTQMPIPDIADKLRVDTVLEGSVVRSGDRIRITAQLIEARTDRHLWAEEYDRDLRDVLTLQGEVARDVAQKISATLTPQERNRLSDLHPIKVDAFEAYLKGRYYWNKRTGESIKKASEYFQQAIEKDPTYSDAYSGLADCNSGLAWHGFCHPPVRYRKPKQPHSKQLNSTHSPARLTPPLLWRFIISNTGGRQNRNSSTPWS